MYDQYTGSLDIFIGSAGSGKGTAAGLVEGIHLSTGVVFREIGVALNHIFAVPGIEAFAKMSALYQTQIVHLVLDQTKWTFSRESGVQMHFNDYVISEGRHLMADEVSSIIRYYSRMPVIRDAIFQGADSAVGQIIHSAMVGGLHLKYDTRLNEREIDLRLLNHLAVQGKLRIFEIVPENEEAEFRLAAFRACAIAHLPYDRVDEIPLQRVIQVRDELRMRTLIDKAGVGDPTKFIEAHPFLRENFFRIYNNPYKGLEFVRKQLENAKSDQSMRLAS